MQPIHELLNYIRRDAAYAESDFETGYYVQVTASIIRASITSCHSRQMTMSILNWSLIPENYFGTGSTELYSGVIS